MPPFRPLSRSMSATGAVILLSSSPPRIFAQSLTAVEKSSSSPALPSPETIFSSHRSTDSPNALRGQQAPAGDDGFRPRWKPTNSEREGFGIASRASGDKPLQEKRGKGNLPVFKARTDTMAGEDILGEKQSGQRALDTTADYRSKSRKESNHASVMDHTSWSVPSDSSLSPETSKSTALSPLCLEKAFSRRLDWTPPKSCTAASSSEAAVASLAGGSLASFSYAAAPHLPILGANSQANEVGLPTKRRRLDIVETEGTTIVAPRVAASKTRETSLPTKARNKSSKKYTTITALATSKYHGGPESEASPMVQYLSSTQERSLYDDSPLPPNTAKRKNTRKKPKAAQKAPQKSALLSPESAMKTFESQDVLFGSASQLAREESPTLIRDTVQAMKQSEDSSFMSDPVATQTTMLASESADTPKRTVKKGISRFVKTRNLWSIADRDGDNALLQVESVDMFDSPEVRTAFAGKDALLEAGPSRLRYSVSPERRLLGGSNVTEKRGIKNSPACGIGRSVTAEAVFDIDELGLQTPRTSTTSTLPNQSRMLHTAAASSNQGTSNKGAERASAASITTSAPMPTRPSFNGFTNTQLASQLVAYGFKPIKKREKMVEILDRCWDDKHRSSESGRQGAAGGGAGAEAASEVVDKGPERTHNDFLTKVHDVSARPLPKVKKPRGRPKKAADGGKGSTTSTAGNGASEGQSAPAKKKRSTVSKAKVAAPSPLSSTKPKRKGKTKAPLSAEYVVDVDDVEEEGHVEEFRPRDDVAKSAAQPASPPPFSLPSESLPTSLLAKEASSWYPDRSAQSAIPDAKPEASTAKSVPSAPRNLKRGKSITTAAATTRSSPPTTTENRSEKVDHEEPEPDTHKDTNTDANTDDPASQIHRAITTPFPTITTTTTNTSPRTQQPTWHQKILLYDPIPLEDLARWLNTTGLARVGVDREVGLVELRTWCEVRGVCCWSRWGREKTKGRGR